MPHFAIVGMQSSGKTLLLSILCGKYISGPIQSKCATKCRMRFDIRLGDGDAETCHVGLAACGDEPTLQAVSFQNLQSRCWMYAGQTRRTGIVGGAQQTSDMAI